MVGGIAKYVRDELEANALYISNEKDAVLLISCDLGGLEPDFTIPAREAIAYATGLGARQIIIGATHTGGPSVIPTNYLKKVDFEYLDLLRPIYKGTAAYGHFGRTETEFTWESTHLKDIIREKAGL